MAALEVTKLGISFGGLRAVDDVSMRIEKGSLVGLIGPNGAGKTTVFNMLTGVYRPTDGGIPVSYTHLPFFTRKPAGVGIPFCTNSSFARHLSIASALLTKPVPV